MDAIRLLAPIAEFSVMLAPVALRRAIEAGGDTRFAPALHLAVVLTAILTVPLSACIMDWIFGTSFVVAPLDVARQVFLAQLLPVGIGAGLRAWRPALAERLEPRLATRNRAPEAVTVAIFGYALGLAAVVGAFLAVRRRRGQA